MIGKLKYLILGSCLMLLGACNSSSPISPRERSDFNADWRFHLGDGLQAAQPGFADNDWRVLNLRLRETLAVKILPGQGEGRFRVELDGIAKLLV